MNVIIGWENSALAQEMLACLHEQDKNAQTLSPEDFLNGVRNPDWKYAVSVNQDIELRSKIVSVLDNENLERIAPTIHRTAYVADTGNVLPGTFVFPFSMVGHSSTVEKDCVLAPYSLVGHRSTLGQGSVMQPGATVAGSTSIGKFCILNLKCTILDKIKICDNVTIAAGAMVTKDIVEPGRYIGAPARKRT